jgi:hypothetical protein
VRAWLNVPVVEVSPCVVVVPRVVVPEVEVKPFEAVRAWLNVPVVEVSPCVVVVPRVVVPIVQVMPLLNVTRPDDKDMLTRTGIVGTVAPAAMLEVDRISQVLTPFLIVMLPFGLDDTFFVPSHHISQKVHALSCAEDTPYTGFTVSDVLYCQ